jgi:surface antigen
MKTKIIASTLVVACLATGCENPKQALGTLGGGALGAWAGSTIGKGRGRVIAAAAGGVLGALLGGTIGGQLDKADRERADRTAQNAFESSPVGKVSEWKNPDTGNYGTITPTRTFQQPSGAYCREYQQVVTIGGKQQQGYGTACRQPDGSWQIQ